MTRGGADSEHQDGQRELEEIKEARAEAAKKKAQNRKKKEKEKKTKMKEGSQQDTKERMQELEEIKVIRELEIEIRDTQHLIDTNTIVAQKVAQEDMVRLQQQLKENKKKMAASSE